MTLNISQRLLALRQVKLSQDQQTQYDNIVDCWNNGEEGEFFLDYLLTILESDFKTGEY